MTETFVAAKLFVDNWRWADTPFYVRMGEPLAHAHVERRVRPAPVVDEQLRGDERLGHRVRRDNPLLALSRHLDALDEPRTVLPAHDVLRPGRVDRLQDLQLLVAHGIRG